MLMYGTVFLLIFILKCSTQTHISITPNHHHAPPLILNAHRMSHIFFLLNYCSANHSYFSRLLSFQVSLQYMWKTLLCMILHDNSNANCLKAVMTSYSVVSKRKLYNISYQYAVKGKVFTLLHFTLCP